MKFILFALFFLSVITETHKLCTQTNLVILNLGTDKLCDIPQHLLSTLIELDGDYKVELVSDPKSVLTFKSVYEPTEDPEVCKDKSDCEVNWSIIAGKTQITISFPKQTERM